ncbi:MAG: exodeoxyribonuclease VII large subunit [Saprospiraceae bacterium]|nr:MAG: exodeoxyribonuclease VII [Bacteroidetes bacterium OLB9]MCO6464904.1 exodeoxyribonuclease VII large subunit [Saprospiraceae bacterium]
MTESYTLYELNEYIKRVIALNFPELIWVNCEIASVKEVKGNVYLDLVYHDDKSDEVTAQMQASIWYKTHLFLKNKLGALLPSLLSGGTHVLIKVFVAFNERYGMKLVIEDIDPSFTIGQMEMNRQKILHQLQNEGLIFVNRQRPIPSVIQRIAVISAHNAAGYIDFVQQLTNNIYGYRYDITLFSASMQGQYTERDVCKALDTIAEQAEKFDVAVIIRGGGSKLDLAWFDNFNIGAKIAKSPLPVITGIGHEIDNTVADVVAGISLKTPTAVADHLINHNAEFESGVINVEQWIVQLAQRILKSHEISLVHITQLLSLIPKDKLNTHRTQLQLVVHQILSTAEARIQNHKDKLDFADREIHFLNPKTILSRGYTLIRQEDKIVSRKADLKSGIPVNIEFQDGKIDL